MKLELGELCWFAEPMDLALQYYPHRRNPSRFPDIIDPKMWCFIVLKALVSEPPCLFLMQLRLSPGGTFPSENLGEKGAALPLFHEGCECGGIHFRNLNGLGCGAEQMHGLSPLWSACIWGRSPECAIHLNMLALVRHAKGWGEKLLCKAACSSQKNTCRYITN